MSEGGRVLAEIEGEVKKLFVSIEKIRIESKQLEQEHNREIAQQRKEMYEHAITYLINKLQDAITKLKSMRNNRAEETT